ncbi:MAG TPA: hypothetical protein VF526_10690, partial [Solirubrobacteraceae bacterium]
EIRLGADGERVEVRARVAASPDEAWCAMTARDRVERWLGTLSAELRRDAEGLRLDFGDGDFFEFENVTLDASAHRLAFGWRFMGCAPRDAIELSVAPSGRGAVVKASDAQPGRGRDASLALGSGWRDFLSRLQLHLATGQRTRYDWRSDVDVAIELPIPAARARGVLIPAAADWLVLEGGEDLFAARALRLDGGGTSTLAIDGVEPAGNGSVRFNARPAGLRRPTTCEMAIEPRGDDGNATLLTIHQTGFRALDADDGVRRQWRSRCAIAWIAAARRARELADAEVASGRTCTYR